MDIATISTVLHAGAVILAVFFGTAQVRALTAQRSLQAGFSLMQSPQTRDMLKALVLLDLQALRGTWESWGLLVFREAVSLDLVNDFCSGSLVRSWRKLQRLVHAVRVETGRETRWRRQWLPR